jgi:hypothetical protein
MTSIQQLRTDRAVRGYDGAVRGVVLRAGLVVAWMAATAALLGLDRLPGLGVTMLVVGGGIAGFVVARGWTLLVPIVVIVGLLVEQALVSGGTDTGGETTYGGLVVVLFLLVLPIFEVMLGAGLLARWCLMLRRPAPTAARRAARRQ